MTKPCNYCGKQIELVKTEKGWRPFNPGDLTPHKCPEGDAAYAAKKKSGGGGYQKDSRSIEKQVCLKEAAETWRKLNPMPQDLSVPITLPGKNYLEAMTEIAQGYRILRDAIMEDESEVKDEKPQEV